MSHQRLRYLITALGKKLQYSNDTSNFLDDITFNEFLVTDFINFCNRFHVTFTDSFVLEFRILDKVEI